MSLLILKCRKAPGGENELMTSAILVLSEEMEKLLARISEDLTSTLVNLSGSQKDIECGTHIKIPSDVGYVNYYKSADNIENISIYLKNQISSPVKDEYQEYLDDLHEDVNTSKS